jgi:hypothetical protein
VWLVTSRGGYSMARASSTLSRAARRAGPTLASTSGGAGARAGALAGEGGQPCGGVPTGGGSTRFDRLVSDLFVYTKLDHLEQMLRRERWDLGSVLERTVAGLGLRAGQGRRGHTRGSASRAYAHGRCAPTGACRDLLVLKDGMGVVLDQKAGSLLAHESGRRSIPIAQRRSSPRRRGHPVAALGHAAAGRRRSGGGSLRRR